MIKKFGTPLLITVLLGIITSFAVSFYTYNRNLVSLSPADTAHYEIGDKSVSILTPFGSLEDQVVSNVATGRGGENTYVIYKGVFGNALLHAAIFFLLFLAYSHRDKLRASRNQIKQP